MADVAPPVRFQPPALGAGRRSTRTSERAFPLLPPWLIIGGTSVLAIACGHYVAHGKVKYGVAIALAAVYTPLVLFDLTIAVAMWAAVLFVQDLRALSIAPNTMGLLVGLGWFGTFIARDGQWRVLGQYRRLVGGLALMVLWFTLSIAWAQAPGRGGSEAGFWALAALAFLITVTTLTRIRDIGLVALAFVAGAVMAAVIGLASGGLYTAATNAVGQTAVQGRLTGGGGDPNLQAAAFVAAMFLAMGLLSVYRRRAARAALVFGFILITIAFFATQSRGGLIALAVATIAALILSPGQRRRILKFVVLLVVVAGIAVAVHPGALARITNVSGGTSGRSDIWNVAAKLFVQHPLVGIGLNNFEIIEPHYALSVGSVSRVTYLAELPDPVHNTYLQLLAETGVIGFALFAAVVLGALRCAWLAAQLFDRTGRQAYGQLARACLMGTIGMLSAIFFITDGDDWRLWILLGLGPALLAVARRGASQANPAGG